MLGADPAPADAKAAPAAPADAKAAPADDAKAAPAAPAAAVKAADPAPAAVKKEGFPGLGGLEHCPDFNERFTLTNGRTRAIAYPKSGYNCTEEYGLVQADPVAKPAPSKAGPPEASKEGSKSEKASKAKAIKVVT